MLSDLWRFVPHTELCTQIAGGHPLDLVHVTPRCSLRLRQLTVGGTISSSWQVGALEQLLSGAPLALSAGEWLLFQFSHLPSSGFPPEEGGSSGLAGSGNHILFGCAFPSVDYLCAAVTAPSWPEQLLHYTPKGGDIEGLARAGEGTCYGLVEEGLLPPAVALLQETLAGGQLLEAVAAADVEPLLRAADLPGTYLHFTDVPTKYYLKTWGRSDKSAFLLLNDGT